VLGIAQRGPPRTPRSGSASTATAAIRKLFTKEQRAFYKVHAPDGLSLDDLTLLGPIFVLKLNTRPEGIGRKLFAAELPGKP
jgi:hypothetical protein